MTRHGFTFTYTGRKYYAMPLSRLAAQHGFRTIKVSSDSRWYWHYGPYMLIDPHTNVIVHSALDADDVARAADQTRECQGAATLRNWGRL